MHFHEILLKEHRTKYQIYNEKNNHYNPDLKCGNNCMYWNKFQYIKTRNKSSIEKH